MRFITIFDCHKHIDSDRINITRVLLSVEGFIKVINCHPWWSQNGNTIPQVSIFHSSGRFETVESISSIADRLAYEAIGTPAIEEVAKNVDYLDLDVSTTRPNGSS